MLHVRWMIRRDFPAVTTIEATTGGTWDEAAFLGELRFRNVVGMVAEQGDRITGFFVYRLHRHSVETLKFAALDSATADGMYEKLVYKLDQHRRKLLVVPVRPEWKTTTVQDVAALGSCPLPILADALQDAGCDEWITNALRNEERETAEGVYRALRHGGLLSK